MSALVNESRLPVSLSPDPNPRRPRHQIPPGAVDCHAHVFDQPVCFPLTPGRSYTPSRCTLENYLHMLDMLGVDHAVQVNASVYGFDNSITLDVLKQLGDRFRGVAVIGTHTPEQEIDLLDSAGFRGARLSTHVKGGAGTDVLEAIAARVHRLGWHLQIHVDRSTELADLEPRLMKNPTPLVFDHIGRVRGGEGIASRGFQALLRMLTMRDDCWVKLSSWYRLSDSGAPDYTDIKPMVHALVKARPDRLVWGSNWPHPTTFKGTPPNDGDLLDLLCDWVMDEVVQRRILVTNPEILYGF